jgi:hypothetical protein
MTWEFQAFRRMSRYGCFSRAIWYKSAAVNSPFTNLFINIFAASSTGSNIVWLFYICNLPLSFASGSSIIRVRRYSPTLGVQKGLLLDYDSLFSIAKYQSGVLFQIEFDFSLFIM